MENISKFCTCKNLYCPWHTTKHNKGCAPCISKNQRLREIPNCFFNLAENADKRTGDSFKDFAEIIINTNLK